jgi:hypothetical protein
VAGFARSAPNLCDRSERVGSARRERTTWHPVGCCCDERIASFTIGEGPDDDRYIRRFAPSSGFSEQDKIACPEFTGSYLSYDGENLYLSQWYNHRILKLDAKGNIIRVIDIGAEISGHAFVDGMIYVLRGTEQNGESWTIARLDPGEEKPQVKDVAVVPFACRSLTFDSANFWSNHRAANEIVSFALPL